MKIVLSSLDQFWRNEWALFSCIIRLDLSQSDSNLVSEVNKLFIKCKWLYYTLFFPTMPWWGEEELIFILVTYEYYQMLAFEQCPLAACWELAWSCDSLQVQQFETVEKLRHGSLKRRRASKESMAKWNWALEPCVLQVMWVKAENGFMEQAVIKIWHLQQTKARTRQGVIVVGRLITWEEDGTLGGLGIRNAIVNLDCMGRLPVCCRPYHALPQLCSVSQSRPLRLHNTGFRSRLGQWEEVEGAGTGLIGCVSFVVPGPAGVLPLRVQLPPQV